MPLPRLAEEDVVAAAIGPPALPEGVPAQVLVGVFDPGVVLVPELVRRRGRVRIAFFPEHLDEAGPLLEGLEAEEDVLLPIGDDVDHVFLEPLAVVLAQPLELLATAEFFLGGRRHRRPHREEKGEQSRLPGLVLHCPGHHWTSRRTEANVSGGRRLNRIPWRLSISFRVVGLRPSTSAARF